MAKNVPELLLEWGLPHDVIQKFIDEDITLSSLPLLSRDDIANLIPKKGPRLVFEKNLEGLKTVSSSPTTPPSLASTSGVVSSSPARVPEQAPVATSTALISTAPPAAPALAPASVPASRPLRVSISEQEPSINDVHAVLKSTAEGVTILSYFNKFRKLNAHFRDELSSRIIYGELKGNYSLRIKLQRYLSLSRQIVSLFPTEDEITYCLVTKNKRRSIVTGKLRQSFYNIRRKFFKVGLISRQELTEELFSDDDDIDPDQVVLENDSILWLKEHLTPWASVLSKWEETFELRKTILRKLSFDEYFKLFPCLQFHAGWELLVQDCEVQYPSMKHTECEWETIFGYLKSQFTERDESFFEEVQESNESVHILTNLASLFKIRNLPRAKKGVKGAWRPGRAEVQLSFLPIVNDVKELDGIKKTRLEVLEKYGFSLQPFPALVGSVESVRQSLVVFGTCIWTVPSPIEAIDICMKVLHALNAQYPPESRPLWLFLQKVVYKLDFSNDFAGDPALKSFLASHLKDFNNYLNSSNNNVN